MAKEMSVREEKYRAKEKGYGSKSRICVIVAVVLLAVSLFAFFSSSPMFYCFGGAMIVGIIASIVLMVFASSAKSDADREKRYSGRY